MVHYRSNEIEQACIIEREPGGHSTKLIPDCPLQKVKIDATISSTLAKVSITHLFQNTAQRNIEAIYTFPLPYDAQVIGFEAWIAGERIDGQIEEKEKAFEQYDVAVRKGNTALLLESHREDVFQLSLGNLMANEQVVITTTYLQQLEMVDGELRWMIPTFLAPRYTPGTATGPIVGPGTQPPTTRVPDADFISPPIGDAHYTLQIEARISGFPNLRKVASPSHHVQLTFENGDTLVQLARETEYLDSDFVLNLTTNEETNSFIEWGRNDSGTTYGIVHLNPQEDDLISDLNHGTIKVMLPPERYHRDYAFLIDVSGSMAGEKLVQAKRALHLALRNLKEGDVFNIFAFESSYESFKKEPIAYTQHSLEQADKWIEHLEDMGGTEILRPLRVALEQTYQQNHHIYIKTVFLITDGQVSNEREIYNLLEDYADNILLYPFGIDTAVNRTFIDRLADVGNGIAEFVYPGERIEDKVMRQFDRMLYAGMSELAVVLEDGVDIEFASPLPNQLYMGKTVRLPFRMHHHRERPSELTITGIYEDEETTINITTNVRGDDDTIRKAWAKATISELEQQLDDSHARREAGLRREIVETSKAYGILSTLTSLIAIHYRTNKAKGKPDTIIVPVSALRSWDMTIGRIESSFVLKNIDYESQLSYSEKSIVMKNVSKSTNDLETLIQDVVQLQHADGLIDGDIDKTKWFLVAMSLVEEQITQVYRIPIQKAIVAVKNISGPMVEELTHANIKSAKYILLEVKNG